MRPCVTLGNLFTPYLVVELSRRAEICCRCATSINDGTQILIFQGTNNNRDFENSRFFDEGLVLISEWHCFFLKWALCFNENTPKYPNDDVWPEKERAYVQIYVCREGAREWN